jgi:phosphoglycolate phosphatase
MSLTACQFRAVIFDLDGTLLDTLADIGNSANAALAELGHPTHPLEAYKTFVGDGVRVLFQRILPESARSAEQIELGAQKFAEIYRTGWNVLSQPYAGVRSLLEELRRRELPLAVLSNKPQAFTELCVAHFLADWKFAAVLGQREGIPCKPDPAAALEIAARVGVAPQACLYLGDTSVDMQTATRAGMFPVGAAWGFRSVQELREHGATVIVHHPCDLLDLLDGNLT